VITAEQALMFLQSPLVVVYFYLDRFGLRCIHYEWLIC
jgi:hypothetical protein